MDNCMIEVKGKDVSVTIPKEAGRIEDSILRLALDNNASFAEKIGETVEGGYCIKATFSEKSHLEVFRNAAKEKIYAEIAKA